ncbi:MAG: cytochrome C biogenesis protein [Chloroflexota bacterium]|nr:MAG: cytochrome C biogenesis protein [Chloroflexota bacterium]
MLSTRPDGALTRFASQVAAIAWKDMLAESRTKEVLSSTFVFAVLVIVVFNFAFELRVETTLPLAPGVLWVAIIFAGVLGLGRSFVAERDRGCLEGLMLCPADRGAIYLGKLLGNLLFMIVVEAVLLPIFFVLFNLPVFTPELLLIVALGTLGFAAVGTLLSAVAVNTRTREVMLPVLLFPVAVPVLIAAVKGTGVALESKGWEEMLPWLNILVAFDAIFLVICFVVFEYVLEE